MSGIVRVRYCTSVNLIHRLLDDLSPCLDFIAFFNGAKINVTDIPRDCIPPNGYMHIAESSSHIIGCSFVKKIGEDVCELSRLFVLPGSRRQGIGTILTQTAMSKAESLGYHLMQLETLPSMKDAISVYNSLGYRIIPHELRSRPSIMLLMVLILYQDIC